MINGPIYGPYIDDEEWEAVYPPEYASESLTNDSVDEEAKENETDAEAYMSDWKDLMIVADVLSDGSVAGAGTGTQIEAVVALMLDNTRKYEFEFKFWEKYDTQNECDL